MTRKLSVHPGEKIELINSKNCQICLNISARLHWNRLRMSSRKSRLNLQLRVKINSHSDKFYPWGISIKLTSRMPSYMTKLWIFHRPDSKNEVTTKIQESRRSLGGRKSRLQVVSSLNVKTFPRRKFVRHCKMYSLLRTKRLAQVRIRLTWYPPWKRITAPGTWLIGKLSPASFLRQLKSVRLWPRWILKPISRKH